jgi:hypothetical protein
MLLCFADVHGITVLCLSIFRFGSNEWLFECLVISPGGFQRLAPGNQGYKISCNTVMVSDSISKYIYSSEIEYTAVRNT